MHSCLLAVIIGPESEQQRYCLLYHPIIPLKIGGSTGVFPRVNMPQSKALVGRPVVHGDPRASVKIPNLAPGPLIEPRLGSRWVVTSET